MAAASRLSFAVMLRVLLPHVLWVVDNEFADDIVGVGVVVGDGSGESSSSLLLSKTLSLAVSHVGMGGILSGAVWASGRMGVGGGEGDGELSSSLLLSKTIAAASSHVGMGGILASGVAWFGLGVGSEMGTDGDMHVDSEDSVCVRLEFASLLLLAAAVLMPGLVDICGMHRNFVFCTLAHIFCSVANVSSLIFLIRG